MNKINIDHLITLYRRSDASRLPEVSVPSIVSAVRKSRSSGFGTIFRPLSRLRFAAALTGAVCGIFLLAFFVLSRPVHREMRIAINISKDSVSVLSMKTERTVKREIQESLVYISRDGRDVSVKL